MAVGTQAADALALVPAAPAAEPAAAAEAEAEPETVWFELVRRRPAYKGRTQHIHRWATPEELAVGGDDAGLPAVARLDELITAIQQWAFCRKVGFSDFGRQDFIAKSTRWDVACQKKMTAVGVTSLTSTHAMLVSQIPTRFAHPELAVGSQSHDDRTSAQKAISDMVNAYQGEIREIEGEWRPLAPEVLASFGEPDSAKDLWNEIRHNLSHPSCAGLLAAIWQTLCWPMVGKHITDMFSRPQCAGLWQRF